MTQAYTMYPNKYYEKASTKDSRYIFLGNQRLGIIEKIGTSTATYLNFTDHLNSSAVTTDVLGNITNLIDYMPYGTDRVNVQNQGFNPNYKFTDQENDPESGLMYYDARYYEPGVGRFVQSDPLSLKIASDYGVGEITGLNQQQLLANPQALNTYSYTANNPIIYVDPDGEFFREAWSFLQGIGNAVLSNNYFGIGRVSTNNSYYSVGQAVGDTMTLFQGAIEAAAGFVTSVTGATITVTTGYTGVGAIAGTGITAAGVGMMGHGGVLAATSVKNGLSSGQTPKQHMLGENGPRLDSKTVGQGKGWRVDIENPAPGQRPGQVHYQDYKGNKYIYDPSSNTFKDYNTGEYISKTQHKRLMNNQNVMKAITKGLNELGEQ